MKSVPIISYIFCGLLLLMLFVNVDQYIPGFRNYYPLFFIIYCLWDIYKSIKYVKFQPENEIRLKTSNDSYSKIFPFIFGSLVCIFSILFFYLFEAEKIKLVLFFIIGLLSIFNGFIFIPSALIKNENDNFYFENGNERKTIEIEQIENIKWTEIEIILNLKNDKKYFFSNLELNETDISKISSFFSKYYKRNIVEI